jgi:hypothetical protein
VALLEQLVGGLDQGTPRALWSLGCLMVLKNEGAARFVRGDEEITLGPGGFVRIPPSVPHSFETLGDTPSRMLDIITPAGLWDFFVEAGEPAQELRLPDEIHIPENLPALVTKANGAVLGPPLNRPPLALQA